MNRHKTWRDVWTLSESDLVKLYEGEAVGDFAPPTDPNKRHALRKEIARRRLKREKGQ